MTNDYIISPAPLLKTILTPTEYAYYETIRENEFKASECTAIVRIMENILKMSPESRQWFMHKSEDFISTVNLLASLSPSSLHRVRAVAQNQFYEEQTAQ